MNPKFLGQRQIEIVLINLVLERNRVIIIAFRMYEGQTLVSVIELFKNTAFFPGVIWEKLQEIEGSGIRLSCNFKANYDD